VIGKRKRHVHDCDGGFRCDRGFGFDEAFMRWKEEDEERAYALAQTLIHSYRTRVIFKALRHLVSGSSTRKADGEPWLYM
jgi:hypothetical protein